jgi:hypothetical protein
MRHKWILILTLAFLVSCAGDDNSSDDGDDAADDTGDDADDDTLNDDASDDADDDGGDDDMGGPPECDENIIPNLISISPLINGVPTEFPFIASSNDEIVFSVEYEDPDCNLFLYWAEQLQGGGIDFAANEGIFPLGKLPEDSPCSTVEFGQPVTVFLDLADRLGFGHIEGGISIYDGCGGESNRVNIEYTMNEW